MAEIHVSLNPEVDVPADAVTTVGAAVATTAATSSTPFGFAEAQANDLVARVNQLRVDVLALKATINEILDQL